MATVRANDPIVVRDPSNPGVMHTIDPGRAYDENDPIVKNFPWAFASDVDRDSGVERATNVPGSRRSVKRAG